MPSRAPASTLMPALLVTHSPAPAPAPAPTPDSYSSSLASSSYLLLPLPLPLTVPLLTVLLQYLLSRLQRMLLVPLRQLQLTLLRSPAWSEITCGGHRYGPGAHRHLHGIRPLADAERVRSTAHRRSRYCGLLADASAKFWEFGGLRLRVCILHAEV